MKQTARYIIIFVILGLLAPACGKQKFTVGAGEPEREFQNCLRLAKDGDHEDAIQCMEMFKSRYPQTPEGVEAMLRIGDIQFQKKDYLLAAESYLAFLRLYPTHPKADYAHYRAGVSYFKESPKAIDRDQGYLDDAVDELRTVLVRYPGSEYSDLTRATLHLALTRIAKRQFYVGKFYYRTGEYMAAIPRFKEVAKNFPDSEIAPLALYKIVVAGIELNRLDESKAAYEQLATRYSKSPYTKRAEGKLLRAVKS